MKSGEVYQASRLRGKRIVKINLGQILADSGDASESLSPITKMFTAWACW
ncbi:MAG: hypothetical protein M3525_07675 [Acidobacteriota bacterium]|nr:hypothetical protein [Acidobacteriota bacterium]